jgi:hypothetical protein
MKISLFKAFIVFSESNLQLISCFLRDGAIYRLFGLNSAIGTEEPEMKLYGATCLMETIDEESEAD